MDFFFDTFRNAGRDMVLAWNFFSWVGYIAFPILLYPLFKVLWMEYAQGGYRRTIRYVLLEIFPPQNIEKSPKIMESIYSAMAGIYSTLNVLEEFVDGKFINKFSLEMVGDSGTVHLYIRTPEAFSNLVKSHLYAQYPDVEIVEVSDYVGNVPGVIPNKEWDLWGTDMQLVGPDPLPIKTYDFFEEDITGKMIDPMAGLIEALGNIGADQKTWFQIVIVPMAESWREEGHKLVEELAGRKKKVKKKSVFKGVLEEVAEVGKNVIPAFTKTPEWEKKSEEKKSEDPLDLRLTPGERKALEALEANVGKNVFRTKMRFVYLGRREQFTKSVISSFIGGIKQFADMNLNSFKPDSASKTFANFYLRDMRLRYRQRKIFRRYKDRDMEGKTFVLSTKELASLFHMPDMVVQSPYLRHVEAKKSGAPANLPI